MKEALNNHLKLAVSLILTFALISVTAFAQKKTKAQDKLLEAKLAESRAEVIRAANDYKASVEKLIELLEKDVAAARDTVERRKKLFEENIIQKRELEDSQRKLAEAEDKVLDEKKKIAEADSVIAEIKQENSTNKSKKPYRKGVLLMVLRLNALPMQEIIYAIKKRGVDFLLAPEDEKEFRLAGASSELIKVIFSSYRKES